MHDTVASCNLQIVFSLYYLIYTGCPRKPERWIFSTLRAESVVYFYIIRWSIFRRREWCLIIQFGWVILSLWPFLEIRSFSNFAGFLRRISGELWRDKPSIRCFCGQQKKHGTMGFHRTTYGLSVSTNFFAHPSQKSSEIWKWPYFMKWS